MELYYEKLYENIFSKRANNYKCLCIVSGYASANFLSRIISEFPHLNIELFIGMAFQGITTSDHSGYRTLMQKNDNIKVYYQMLGVPNHMKVYQFSGPSLLKTFIGSANFSDTGFFKHKEILTESVEVPNTIFEEQRKNSLLCTNPLVEQHIDFYENEYKEFIESEDEKTVLVGESKTEYRLVKKEKRERAKRKWELLRGNMDPMFYRSFEITVMMPPENNPRWNDRGINSWVNNKTPVIEQTPRLSFSTVFPQEEFIVYTDDNEVMKARLNGNFNGNLEFLNINLYQYIKQRIGLVKERPISYSDLILAGYAKLYFTRLNYNEYVMSFNENDKLF